MKAGLCREAAERPHFHSRAGTGCRRGPQRLLQGGRDMGALIAAPTSQLV